MKTIIQQAVGERPLVIAQNYVQHEIVCRALGLNPRKVLTGSNPHALDGARPTSVIWAPGWHWGRFANDIANIAHRLCAKSPTPVPEYRLTEDDLR